VPAGTAEPEDSRSERGGTIFSQQATDRRFDQSLRVVKNAVLRRSVWKRERDNAEKP
jgi:hypothetical protein